MEVSKMNEEIRKSLKNYYDVYFGIGAIYEKLAKKHGLTSTSLFVLSMINDYPDQCTQKLICDILFYPKQTVNTILISFEKKGFISKKVSEQDKRNKIIQFTKTGQSFADSVLTDTQYLEETAFSNMHPDDRNAMIQGERAFLNQLAITFALIDG
jgi:DNA-binding MarR family transcriptional regulator